jgi:hypothetical protein
MKRIFRWTLYGFAIYFVLAFIAIFAGIAVGEESELYNVFIGLVAALILTSPFLALTSLITGIGSYRQGKQDSKQKRDFMPYDDYGMQDARLERIMKQISPQDRAYLERRLADQEVGLGNDGEIISMDDLLNEYEEKSKRD